MTAFGEEQREMWQNILSYYQYRLPLWLRGNVEVCWPFPTTSVGRIRRQTCCKKRDRLKRVSGCFSLAKECQQDECAERLAWQPSAYRQSHLACFFGLPFKRRFPRPLRPFMSIVRSHIIIIDCGRRRTNALDILTVPFWPSQCGSKTTLYSKQVWILTDVIIQHRTNTTKYNQQYNISL